MSETADSKIVMRQGVLLDRLSDRFRRSRAVLLAALIARRASLAPGKTLRIADLGGSYDYWRLIGFDLLEQHDAEVTCINLTKFELHETSRHPRIKTDIGDVRNLANYNDNSFDIVHSNSVVEHVGLWADMESFAREVLRLAPAHFVQTPYAWFPIDPHFPRLPFFHMLPLSTRLMLVRRFRIGRAGPARNVAHAMQILESSVLLDRTRFRTLFADSDHRFEWLVFPKSMIAIKGM